MDSGELQDQLSSWLFYKRVPQAFLDDVSNGREISQSSN